MSRHAPARAAAAQPSAGSARTSARCSNTCQSPASRSSSHIRPKLSCRSCETIVQAPMPSLPIERGLPGPGLMAHVLVSKFADHTPLHRQAVIYAREGVELDRATLADWSWARPSSCWRLWPKRLLAMSAPATCCMPTTPPSRKASPPAWARPRPGGSGSSCVTSGPGVPWCRQRRSTNTRPIARASMQQALLGTCHGFLHADGALRGS